MIYTDIDEANIEIQRLNDELLKSSGSRVIVSNYIEASVNLLNVSVEFADFIKEDGTYHSILSYSELRNRTIEYNHDNTRFYFAYELSDLNNVYGNLKAKVLALGGQLGGSDFTSVGDGLFWILTYSEWKKHRELNGNWAKQTIN